MIKNAIELSGRYLNSMVRAMHEFKELGEAVLSRYHVRHIDLDAYYLASMRRDMLTQVRDRFGDEGVMYVAIEGVKDLVDGDLSSVIGPDVIDKLRYALRFDWDSKSQRLEEACLEFVSTWMLSVNKIVNSTHRNHGYRPWRFESLGQLRYKLIHQATITTELHWNTLGQIYGLLHAVLPQGISYEVNFLERESRNLGEYSELIFSFNFIPLDTAQTHEEMLLSTRIALREKIFTAALRYAIKLERVAKDALKQRDEAFEITASSIRYAQLIQTAQLPGLDRQYDRFAQLAVCWEPRDVIGGDIWWMSPSGTNETFSFVLADCTGHGVPGAMLSTLLAGLLERIYVSNPSMEASDAYRDLKDSFHRTFRSESGTPGLGLEGGFDALILQIDRKKRALKVAGRGIGFVMVRDGRANRVPLRGLEECALSIEFEPGDRFILYTDGLSEQLGRDTKGRRLAYGHRRLLGLVEQCGKETVERIKDSIYHDWTKWVGNERRVDDFTLICFEVV
jgi:hypothetical protein